MFSTELAKRGFRVGSWNFFEAGNGKGAPDGVGATLKRTADRLISQGIDIPNAHTLYRALEESNTAIKLHFIEEEAVEKALRRMPANLPVVPSTMRIHQVVCVAAGQIAYRDVSCMCIVYKQLECQCFYTQHFKFDPKDTSTWTQRVFDWQNPNTCGGWCVIKYDDDFYPGVILATDESLAQVKCMSCAGPNRFFWPLLEDILWYPFEDVLEPIDPPNPVTSRHMEIQKEVWARLHQLK